MLNNETKISLYLIDSGPMLDLVKHHIAERDRVFKAKIEILKHLGLDPKHIEVWASRDDGGMTAVRWPTAMKLPKKFVAGNWTKADSQGRRRPKKGTEEYKVFYAPEGSYTPASVLIAEKLNVPGAIGYKSKGGEGWTRIGRMLNECGFLWMHKDTGPYAMWTPDVKACVEEMREQFKGVKSFKILGGADTWTMDTTGLRPILEEEWDLMVSQKNLEEAREEAAKKVAA